MHKVIKEILMSDKTSETKRKQIDEIKESINLAERIFTGELAFCKLCQDYYMSKSFYTDTIVEEENVCVYSDPINSGGDEYERQKFKYTRRYCPKGHAVLLVNKVRV